MSRTIKARDVKPGMEIEWTQGGIKYTCVVESIRPSGVVPYQSVRACGGANQMVYDDQDVTVLTEPQPEEPQAFGACVRVDGVGYVRYFTDGAGTHLWVSGRRVDGMLLHSWGRLTARGHVEVVNLDPFATEAKTNVATIASLDLTKITNPPMWFSPATPVIPDRIEVWPGDDEHLRAYGWRDVDGDAWWFDHTLPSGGPSWRFRSLDGFSSSPFRCPRLGPWERVTDA